MNIEWKEIEGYNRYLVSSSGDIKSLISNKILKKQKKKNGYEHVGLYRDGK